MKQYQEISSIFRDKPTRNYVPTLAYKQYIHAYPEFKDELKLDKLFRLISAQSPAHPLAKRFDKLIKYTARLTGNPNYQEVKKSVLKIMKTQDGSPDIYHDLFHMILGQSIEIFLKRKNYTLEEYIYEMIAAITEGGLDIGCKIISYNFSRLFPKIVRTSGVSIKKVYQKEFRILRQVLKKYNQFYRFPELKRLFLLSNWFVKYHFIILLKISNINPIYPLAVNFKNEVLKNIPKSILGEYRYYLVQFKAFCELLCEYYDSEITDDVRTFREHLKESFTKDDYFTDTFFRKLLSDIEIFPQETKEIVKKFITYTYAVLSRYPLK